MNDLNYTEYAKTADHEEYNKLISENQKLQEQIKWLTEMLKLKNSKTFGSSSEKTS